MMGDREAIDEAGNKRSVFSKKKIGRWRSNEFCTCHILCVIDSECG
jgi:hypothetical protein